MKKWNRQQPVTRDPGSSAFLEYLAAIEREIAAGGGGGGSVAWGGITGTLSAQTDLQTALNGKANTSHTHSAADITSGTLAAARFDDTSHGTRSGGTLHAAATTSVAGFMSAADKTKLDGIAAGATANATDAALRDRTTHTGTQAASTISDFSEAVDDRVAALLVAGSNVTLTYNDAANTLTIAASGGGGGGGSPALAWVI